MDEAKRLSDEELDALRCHFGAHGGACAFALAVAEAKHLRAELDAAKAALQGTAPYSVLADGTPCWSASCGATKHIDKCLAARRVMGLTE